MGFFDRSTRPVPVWACFLIPALMVTLMGVSIYSDIRELQDKGPLVETLGSVAKLDCSEHGNYSVSFLAEGRAIVRRASSFAGHRDCGAMTVGQAVSVWYSTAEPRYVSFVSPGQVTSALMNELGAMVFVGYPVLVLFLLATRRFSIR
jgi:hypothetical protein